jgi:uncharacterized membrane protein
MQNTKDTFTFGFIERSTAMTTSTIQTTREDKGGARIGKSEDDVRTTHRYPRRDERQYPRPKEADQVTDPLAQRLGWFSIGLGLAEIFAPREVAQMIGIQERRAMMRVLGMRQIVSGLGILSGRRPVGSLWSRVGGDVMDLALLGMAFKSERVRAGRIVAATAAVAGVTLLDVLASERMARQSGMIKPIYTKKTIGVNRSPEDLYKAWRNLEELPRYMRHLKSVRVLDEKTSHWVVKAQARTTVEWDAELVKDRPNEMIAWHSLPGATVDNSGSIRFQKGPESHGTIVTVELRYNPPAGQVGAAFAKLFGEAPEQQIAEDLRRFKQVMETGEIPTTEGQPSGRTRSETGRKR